MNQSAQALAAHPADLAVSRPTAVAASASVKLKVQDLHKSYGEHEVLKGVSLNASKGDVISLIGASGSGKKHPAALHQLPRTTRRRGDYPGWHQH